jgi:hypothetical protein
VNISFVTPGDETLASVRYRMLIPAEALREIGHTVTVGGMCQGEGFVVFSKHNAADIEASENCSVFELRTVFDVCDDHFHDKHAGHYREMIQSVDILTCSTTTMQEVIKAETGRDAIQIDDPYEFPEEEPVIKKPGRTMWFGHKSNLPSIEGYAVDDKISNAPGCMPWSMETMIMAFDRNQIVLIPHSDERKNAVKSPNRVIESIRMGKWVSASPIRSYEQFKDFANIGNVKAGIEMYNDLPDDVLITRIKAGQDYIRDRFSPETIAKQWLKALSV